MDFLKGCCGTHQCGKVARVTHTRDLGILAAPEGMGLCRVTVTFWGKKCCPTSLPWTHHLLLPAVTFLCPLPTAAIAWPR